MVAPRPVDSWPKPALFHFPRREALSLGCCARCGVDVNPAALSDIDAREYGISAMCPQCFFDVTGPDDDGEPDYVGLVSYLEGPW